MMLDSGPNGIPFMITQAMRSALHARGLSDAEIDELKPEQAHKLLNGDGTKPDKSEVRKFLKIIVAQAIAATQHRKEPGVLQVTLIHPSSEDVTGIYRYALDDPKLVERMTDEAFGASESGHNVYVEDRLVRRGLGPKERGKVADTLPCSRSSSIATPTRTR